MNGTPNTGKPTQPKKVDASTSRWMDAYPRILGDEPLYESGFEQGFKAALSTQPEKVEPEQLKRLKRKVPNMPKGRLARQCELQAIMRAEMYNKAIDDLAAKYDLVPKGGA